MLRTECELNEKVPPSPPETLVQGLGPLDSPLSIGFEAQCMSRVAMACPACLHALMLRHDCTHRTCLEIDVLTHSDEYQEGLEGCFSSQGCAPAPHLSGEREEEESKALAQTRMMTLILLW